MKHFFIGLKKSILLGLLLLNICPIFCQVGFDNPNPSPSAVIDMASKDKGLLIPRMSTVDRENMLKKANIPAHALLVFDLTQNMFFVFDTIPNPDRWAALNPFSIPSNSTDIISSTKGTVKATKFEGYGTIPIGGIIMWSGVTDAIPDGWTLCDGSTVGGIVTPDLRERFIVGASRSGNSDAANDNTTVEGNPYNVKQTGGTNAISLTINEMPTHDHKGRTGGPKVLGTQTSVDFDHTHNYTDTYPNAAEEVADRNVDDVWDNTNTTETKQSARANINTSGHGPLIWNNHDHPISPQGGSQPFDKRPPFFALAFIIRTK